jgi:hypothetical protein
LRLARQRQRGSGRAAAAARQRQRGSGSAAAPQLRGDVARPDHQGRQVGHQVLVTMPGRFRAQNRVQGSASRPRVRKVPQKSRKMPKRLGD